VAVDRAKSSVKSAVLSTGIALPAARWNGAATAESVQQLFSRTNGGDSAPNIGGVKTAPAKKDAPPRFACRYTNFRDFWK